MDDLRQPGAWASISPEASNSVLVGAGIGLAYASQPALIISAVPPEETSAENGLNTLMRSIGTSVSSAVIGIVLADTSHTVGGVTLPSMHGFQLAFLIATAVVAAGLLLALCLPKPRHASQPHTSGEGKTADEPAESTPSPTLSRQT